MRSLVFTKRCLREILRDPITLFFGAAFPVILLVLLSVMNLNIPAEAGMQIFAIENLMPGVIVFGFSFLALFGGMLLAGDRETAFLTRLFTSPLRARDFIAGYALPLFPLGLAQAVICVVIGFIFGLSPTVHILTMLVFLIPSMLLFVSLGLLCGSVLNFRQVGSICGALLTNLTAWLSGVWFDLDLVGGGFRKIANLFPFVHAAELEKALFDGHFNGIGVHLLVVILYAALVTAAAVLAFLRQMRKQ